MKIIYILSILLFLNGILIIILKRSFIYILMGIELSLSSLSFLLFLTSRILGNPDGEIYAIIIFGISASGVAIGLGILINLMKRKGTQEIEEFKDLGK